MEEKFVVCNLSSFFKSDKIYRVGREFLTYKLHLITETLITNKMHKEFYYQL
jgi:hypothetical protein